jgi:hypothetical protein
MVGTSYLEGRNVLKDATVFLFLHDVLLVPAVYLYSIHHKGNLKFLSKAVGQSVKTRHFWFY